MKTLIIVEFGLLSGVCFGVAAFWTSSPLAKALYFLLGVLWFLVGKFLHGVVSE